MARNLKIDDRQALHHKVCNVLREAIVRGDFQPGDRLVQEDLAEELGVSRMPIREALKQLEAEGLVTLEPHKGAVVNELTVKDIEEIYSLRAYLEGLAVSRSVPNLTGEDVGELDRLTKAMEASSEDMEAFIRFNIEFHKVLLRGNDWTRLRGFIENLWNGFPHYTPYFLTGQVQLSNGEHEEILSFVRLRDGKKTGAVISRHIARTGESLCRILSEKQRKR